MKTDISSVHLHPLIVFLALFFSTNTVQPLSSNSFNPNNYLHEHYIEYVIPETSDFFLSLDFTHNFQEATSSVHLQQISTTAAFVGVTASDWSTFPSFYDTSILLLNSIPQACSPVSVHIRFIKHQSFSDCDPDHSFLI
jgi:hypothetical protein